MNRRLFLSASAAAPLALAANEPKRIAAIITEYRPGSHADVVIGKYLEGYKQDDKPPYPRNKIVSMFTEQVPKADMSRERAKKYGVPLYRTVVDALTLVFDDGLATADRSPGKHTFAMQSGAAHHDARAAMGSITHRHISHGYATHGYANTDCRQIRL